jgi:acylphosphatase
MEEITKHYLISGRVQGVGFRAFTQRHANDMGVLGWVRNLFDGRVEILARGPDQTLSLFEAKLKSGPSHGHVESMVVTQLSNTCDEKSDELLRFVVRKDGQKPCTEN